MRQSESLLAHDRLQQRLEMSEALSLIERAIVAHDRSAPDDIPRRMLNDAVRILTGVTPRLTDGQRNVGVREGDP